MMKKLSITLGLVGLTTLSGAGLALAKDRNFSDRPELAPSYVIPVASLESPADESGTTLLFLSTRDYSEFPDNPNFPDNQGNGDGLSILDLGIYFDELTNSAPDVSIYPIPRPGTTPVPPVIVVAPALPAPAPTPAIARQTRPAVVAPAVSAARTERLAPALIIGVYR